MATPRCGPEVYARDPTEAALGQNTQNTQLGTNLYFRAVEAIGDHFLNCFINTNQKDGRWKDMDPLLKMW